MADSPTRRQHDHRTTNPTRCLQRRIQPPPTTPLPGPRATPAAAYQARPKAAPGTRLDTHDRADRISQAGSIPLRLNGRLHHIGIGHIHYRTRVVILVQDLDIRVINAATGELLRELALDPHTEKAADLKKVRGYPDVLRHHIGRAERI
jgi:hypothetical protein